jgi:amino acid transporter
VDICNANWTYTYTAKALNTETNSWIPISGAGLIVVISTELVGSLFSSLAWEGVTFIAGEIKKSKRNVGASLFLGALIVSCIYILKNFMYLSVVPHEEQIYTALGYSILPAFYIVITTVFGCLLLLTKVSTCCWGILIMLIRISIYYLIKQKE